MKISLNISKNVKRKILITVVMLFFTIGLSTTVYAACLNCLDDNHDQCTSWRSWGNMVGASGWHERYCCDGQERETHQASFKYVTTKEATCTSTGTRKYTCSNCSMSYTSTVAKLDHTWGTAYFSDGDYGCHNRCTVCSTANETTAHLISGNLEWYDYYNNTQHYRMCSKCLYQTGFENHTYKSEVTEAATCIEEGTIRYYCEYCPREYTGTLSKTGHNWGSYVANGSTGHRQKCTVCSAYNTTLEHTYSNNWVTSLSAPSYSHCHRCTVCNYEIDTQVHDMVVSWTGTVNGIQQHKLSCSICGFENAAVACTYESKITKEATCTEEGNRRYTCVVCSQYYDEAIAKIPHVWSDWDANKTQHWKNCTYGCGTTTSTGEHVDTNPRNGRCDTCNYLMYVLPVANISEDVAVKEGEKATFVVNMVEGSEPLTYQWYYKTSASGSGTLISGETSPSITITTTKEMNGRLYYCFVSNPGGDYTTSTAKLTVYYTFTIGTHPQNLNLKNGEEGTFSVSIGTAGNPDSYTYQWYLSNSETGAGSKINGATTNSYTVKPTKNIHAEYYYCVINNGKYEIASNRGKLTADVTLPDITMGSFNQNAIINNTATITIPFIVTDTGEGYTENNSNFTASDIIVKVDGTTNTGVTKTLTYKGTSGTNYNYELTLTNINDNGKLSFNIPAGAVEDNFHNQNTEKTFSTNVTIDNVAPVISFDSVEGDLNDKYANTDDTIKITLKVTEEIGMNTGEFTADDIVVKVGGTEANSALQKTLTYVEKVGNDYIYELTLTKIKGDGVLSITIPANKIQDLATNKNVATNLPITIDGENVTIDNTKPVIDSLVTTLGSYNSSRDYPTSLAARQNDWSNEDIYVQINASDTEVIECYMKSVGNNTSYTELTSNQDKISDSVEANIYYRVLDKAGNYAEVSKMIKLDKITPNKPVISLFEQRQNGAIYTFDANKPVDKSVYVIPDASTVVDTGVAQSGIDKSIQYTYYTIHSYVDITKTATLRDPVTYAWNEGFLLDETGYYELVMTMTDIAGNQIVSDVYKVYIDKKAENTIRINNINDIGSGIKKVTINVYKSDDSGNKTTEKAISTIVVENPYKEIIKNVRLGEGKFYVEVVLEDKVGLTTKLEKSIQNDL